MNETTKNLRIGDEVEITETGEIGRVNGFGPRYPRRMNAIYDFEVKFEGGRVETFGEDEIEPPRQYGAHKAAETVDLTPSWSFVVEVAMGVLSNPDASAEGRKTAEEELRRLAKWADRMNAKAKDVDLTVSFYDSSLGRVVKGTVTGRDFSPTANANMVVLTDANGEERRINPAYIAPDDLARIEEASK